MRRLAAFLAAFALGSAAAAEAQGPHKVYALVAALGDTFYSTYQENGMRTGTRLEGYRRNTHTAPDNALNRLALATLDETIGKLEPQSRRIYLAIATPRPRGATQRMEEIAFEAVLEQLKSMPERSQWHRIVVATPAYRTLGGHNMPGRMQGAGVHIQAACTSEVRDCDTRAKSQAEDTKVETPSGEEAYASRFVAPWLAIKIWILDPRTLEVLDAHESIEYRKYYDPSSDSMEMTENVGRRFLATKIVELVERTTREAVMSTELRGTVEVKEKGSVKEGSK